MGETFRPAIAGRDHPLLSYGIPFYEAAARHLRLTFKCSRVYVLCSGSLASRTNAFQQLKDSLADQLIGYRIGMKPHTFWSEVLDVVNEVTEVKADLLLTLGAGSLTDAAKVVSVAVANRVTSVEGLSRLATGPDKQKTIEPPTIPVISIPTSLSAGEYTDAAGATEDSTRRKQQFGPPSRGPQLVILDPDLCTNTPASVWLSTGMRAVDHCVEALCSVDGAEPSGDDMARRGLSRLIPGLLNCRRDMSNKDAVLQCQLGAVDAIGACLTTAVQLGGSHGIGHQLGPLGVGHGETSCIMLPAVCKYNAAHDANRDRQGALTVFLLSMDTVVEMLQDRALDPAKVDLGDILDCLVRHLGLPRTLSDVGVVPTHFNLIAENSLKDACCKTNPKPLTSKAQVLEILELVAL